MSFGLVCEPLVLFNVLERRFIIFGLHFAPQDFYLFVLAMLTIYFLDLWQGNKLKAIVKTAFCQLGGSTCGFTC